jgi:hypothetical protein
MQPIRVTASEFQRAFEALLRHAATEAFRHDPREISRNRQFPIGLASAPDLNRTASLRRWIRLPVEGANPV